MLFVAYMLLTLYACSNIDDCKVDCTIDTKFFIVNSGFKTIDFSNLVNDTYQIYVYKGGYNKESIKVGLNEVDSILTNYNVKNSTTYKLLPSSYYTIQDAVVLNNSHVSDSIGVKFNSVAIKNDGIDNNYVLPIAIKNVPANKTGSNNYILLQSN